MPVSPIALSSAEFRTVVRLTPLVSIDLVIRNARDEVLLGLRNNEPAKGFYFVPGGAIRKNESLEIAFARIMKTEVGCDAAFADARFLGIYQHFYPTNRFGEAGYGTHYVALDYEIALPEGAAVKGDDQHSELSWWSEAALFASDRVHDNTKAYLRR